MYTSETGCVYRYRKIQQGGWAYHDSKCANIADEGFGSSIGVLSTDVVVGAPYTSGQQGAARFFATSSWTPFANISPSDGSTITFGRAAVMLDSTALIGAPRSSSGSGKVLRQHD
jgi:hypothetical protein